jgi:hypothetical protein
VAGGCGGAQHRLRPRLRVAHMSVLGHQTETVLLGRSGNGVAMHGWVRHGLVGRASIQ